MNRQVASGRPKPADVASWAVVEEETQIENEEASELTQITDNE